jgi:hypothetical protein
MDYSSSGDSVNVFHPLCVRERARACVCVHACVLDIVLLLVLDNINYLDHIPNAMFMNSFVLYSATICHHICNACDQPPTTISCRIGSQQVHFISRSVFDYCSIVHCRYRKRLSVIYCCFCPNFHHIKTHILSLVMSMNGSSVPIHPKYLTEKLNANRTRNISAHITAKSRPNTKLVLRRSFTFN